MGNIMIISPNSGYPVNNVYKKEAGTNSGHSEFSNQTMGKKVYLKTDDMLYSGGNGTGLSYYIKYAEESTEDNPAVIAKGVDENGNEFEQTIFLNQINPSRATIVEMRALEAHYNVEKGSSGLSSLPLSTGNMGLSERSNFIDIFEKSIQEMKTLGRYDLVLQYMKNRDVYIALKS